MSRGLPDEVEEVLDGSLVAILTVVNDRGRPVSHPMLPLYDRSNKKLYFTSSILFSKKLEHIKRNPRVSVLFSQREFIRSPSYHVVMLKGDARVIDEDLSRVWTSLLPLWRRKEPYIDAYLKQRVAFPLFWERAVIEVIPKATYVWRGGDMLAEPVVLDLGGG
jgi:general stress protein 26